MKAVKIISNTFLLAMVVFLGYSYVNKVGIFSQPTEQYVTRTKVSDDAVTIGSNFDLINQDGNKVSNRDFINKYMLVLFGFSSCKGICPIELGMVSEVLSRLGNDANKLQVVFITVDPQRDTPQALKDYHKSFDTRIQMLTGDSDQLKKVANDYKVYVSHNNDSSSGDIDHSSIMYLMGKDGKYLAHFSPDLQSENSQVDKLFDFVKQHI